MPQHYGSDPGRRRLAPFSGGLPASRSPGEMHMEVMPHRWYDRINERARLHGGDVSIHGQSQPVSTFVAPEGTPNYGLLEFLSGLINPLGDMDVTTGTLPVGPGGGIRRGMGLAERGRQLDKIPQNFIGGKPWHMGRQDHANPFRVLLGMDRPAGASNFGTADLIRNLLLTGGGMGVLELMRRNLEPHPPIQPRPTDVPVVDPWRSTLEQMP